MTASTEEQLERCVEVLRQARRVLLVMHECPDGDALGSALGLAQALLERGADPVVYTPQGAPSNLRFLPCADRIVRELPKDVSFEVTVACDAGDVTRLGPGLPEAPRRGLLLNLDHHPRTQPWGDINVVDPQAAAVGVIIHRLLRRLGHPLSMPVALGLWVSLVSDTGHFRHGNTNGECMRIASELVEAGVRPSEVASKMYESQPLQRVRLLAEVLRTLAVTDSGRVAWVSASRELFARAGTADETADGFISYPRSIEGVEVAMLFREESPQTTRVSFRSRGKVDVGALASRFGGGGHHNASGCSFPADLDDARRRMVALVEAELDRLG